MNRPTVRPKVRSDVALIPGYHSPQLDVAVRLNTNEAPEPPPVDFGRRLGELLANADWNRYPDREATRLRTRIAEVEGTTADRVFAANGSNEVLQCLALAFGGAGRRALTFEPTYALHGHICRMTGTDVVSEPRAEDFTLDPATVAEAIARHQPSITFLCEQRGWIEARFGELDVESWPSSANFVLFRPAARKGADVWQRLVDRGVLVRNCASWPGLDGCLRVTVGTPKENRAFIEALTLVLELD